MKNGGTNPDTFTGTAEEYEDLPDEYKTTMLPSAVIEGDFVPQDIPEGYDPYINNSMEQKIFDNLGMEGVLEYRNIKEGQHKATGPLGEVIIELLSLIEGGPLITRGAPALGRAFLRKTGKYLDDIPEGSFYRGLGKEGMEDALHSGVLRPRQSIKPTDKSSFNLIKDFDELYVSPQSEIAKRYGKGNIAVIPKDAAEFFKTYGRSGKDWSMYTKENIPIDKIRLLKENPYVDIFGRPRVGYKILKNKGGKINPHKVKKLENGGTPEGDPKKIVAQSGYGFPLYLESLEDGTTRVTPTPRSGNYIKLPDRGYYSDGKGGYMPIAVGEATIFGGFGKDTKYTKRQQKLANRLLELGYTHKEVFNDPDSTVYIGKPGERKPSRSLFKKLDSIESAIEKTGGGMFDEDLDYEVPYASPEEKEAFKADVRGDMNLAGKTMAALTGGTIFDVSAYPQRYLVNPAISAITGKPSNLNPVGYTQSFLQGLGYGDDPGEGFMTPSEGLSIQNPYLAFGVDMFTDPLTYLGGAGVLRGGLKGGLRSSLKPGRINISSLKGSYPLPGLTKSTVAKDIGSKTHEIFGKFLSKHHPDVIEGVQKGTLSIDDVMSDPKLVEDFINKHQYSYRGFTADPNVPGQVESFASTYRYPRAGSIDKNQHGAGIYSYAGDAGAKSALESYTGILSRDPLGRSIGMDFQKNYPELFKNKQPFLARLKTNLPKFNPDDISSFWKDYGKFQQYGRKIPSGTSQYLDIPHLWKGQRSGQLFTPSEAQRLGFSADELNKSLLSRIGEYGDRGFFNPDLYRYGQEAYNIPGFKTPRSFLNPGGDMITTVARPGSGIQSIDEIIQVPSFDPTIDQKLDIIQNISRPSLKYGGKVKVNKRRKLKVLKN